MNIVLYTSKTDDQYQAVKQILDQVKKDHSFNLVEINIDDEEKTYSGYQGKTPVLEIGPYHLFTPFTLADVVMTLGAARDRHNSLVKNQDTEYLKKMEKGSKVSGTDKFSLWLTKSYMFIFNALLLIFCGLPFLAPVLVKSGLNIPAKLIYTIYSPLCHQLAYRSWFLFGEQAAYPRELADLKGETFEEATGYSSGQVLDAKNFIGNEKIGYKVALCERDVAIYGGILLFGLLFQITGRKLKSLPWYIWVVMGIIPMGIDGVSQLPSLLATQFAWVPMRESTPLLRTITGLMFGITTAWYGYPLIEETMRDSRKILQKKIAVVGTNS